MKFSNVFFSTFKALGLVLVLLPNLVSGQVPNGTLDFGTTSNATTATTANTGFGGVRIGTGSGTITLANSGQEIGTEAELKLVAPTGASINAVCVTSTEYGTAANTFTITFEMHLSGGASGTMYFFAGNGATFNTTQSSAFSGTQTFTGLRWTFNASDAITTNNRLAGNWVTTGLTGTPFAQNTAYTVTIVGNNSASAVSNYDGVNSVAANTFDLWINGVLVGNDLGKAQLANATNVNAFRFYGENSTGNVATLSLDNIKWWNTCVAPSVSTYSALSNIPSGTYTDLNINSVNGMLLGATTVGRNLTFTSGKLTLGANNLTIGSSGSISGASSSNYVVTDGNGVLTQSNFAGEKTFPVGTAAAYAPVKIDNSAASRDFSVKVGTTFSGTPVAPTKMVQLEWNVTPSNLVGNNAALTFQWPASVENGSFNRANAIEIAHYNTGSATWDAFKLATLGGSGPYTATATGFTDFSPFVVGNQNALSVDLLNISAQSKGTKNLITWSTASEKNNAYFEVQHATNGLDFTTISDKIKGNGTTTVKNDYAFDHLTPSVIRDYYRLKQVDNDGTTTLSKVVSVVATGKNGALKVYPTLASDKLNISLESKETVDFNIYNLVGQSVQSGQLNGQKELIISHLPSGVYLLKVGNATVKFSKN